MNLTILNNFAMLNNDSFAADCKFWNFLLSGVSLSSITFFGTIFNILAAIIWLTMNNHKNNVTTILVICLEISDTVILIFFFIFQSLHTFIGYVNEIVFKEYASFRSKAVERFLPIENFARITSNWIIVIISIERYFAICRPTTKAKLFTPLRIKIGVGLLALFGLFFSLPRAFEYEICYDKRAEYYKLKPTFLKTNNEIYGILYRILLQNIIVIILPFILIVSLTILTLRTLTRKVLEVQTHLTSNIKYITRSLMAVNILFICSFIFEIFRLIISGLYVNEMIKCGHFFFYFTSITYNITCFNSAANFFLFAFLNKIFYKRFLKFFKRNVVDISINGQTSNERGSRSRTTKNQ